MSNLISWEGGEVEVEPGSEHISKKKYPTAHYGDNNALKRAEKSKTFSRVVGKITFLMNLMKTKRSPQDS